MHVALGEVRCSLSKGWLKRHVAIIDTQADHLRLSQQEITALMSEGGRGR